jgi:hypothetical protein
MVKVTYNGKAKDSINHPAVYKIDPDTGRFETDKKGRRIVEKPRRTEHVELKVFKYNGLEFPAGKAVEVDVPKSVLAKLKALSFLLVEEVQAKKS